MTRLHRRSVLAGALAMLGAMSLGESALAEKGEIGITRQPSIIYMPSHIIEARRLIEKHADALGVPNLKVNWISFQGGGAATDALLAGNVDVVNTGVGNMLLLWDRTRGNVKGIIATSALPLILVTRKPEIKSIRDVGPTDRIAVPTVKVSTQAILLQMQATKEFGPDQYAKLDGNTVQLGHPEAAAALSSPAHEVQSHFSAPPFVFQTLRTVPGARMLLRSNDVVGGPLTVALLFSTTKFVTENPKIVQALKAASLEALEMIRTNPREAAEVYRENSKDRMTVDDILEMLKEPGMTAFETHPQGTMKFAEHLHRIGTLKTRPASWKDYFFPIAHDGQGD